MPKLSTKSAKRIADLYNSIAVGEDMRNHALTPTSINMWITYAEEAAAKLKIEFGIEAIGYRYVIVDRGLI